MKTFNQYTLEEAKVHPMAVHAYSVGGGNYKVHAVGSKVEHVKAGETIRSSDLDDLTDAGHKVKEINKPMNEEIAISEAHTLSHSSYPVAINTALSHHKDLTVSSEDRGITSSLKRLQNVMQKPAEGETVKHAIPATDKAGNKHMIHIHVHNKGGDKPFETKTHSSKVSNKPVNEALGTIKNIKAASKFKPENISAMRNAEKARTYPKSPTGMGHSSDAHFNQQSQKMQDAINLHLRNGKDYPEAVKAAKVHVKEAEEMRHSSDSLGDHMALKAYANKRGGIDKHDLLTAASHMAFGNMDHLKKHLKALDTDVRDKALEYVARRHHAELGYSVRKEEADEKGYVAVNEGFGVFRKGVKHNPVNPIKVHKTKEKADKHAKRLNSIVSPYVYSPYGEKYHVKPMSEEAELDEANSHREVDNLKSKGKHHEAGQHAAKSGHDRQYGAHFGMRSDKEEAQRQFFKGYDSVKKTNEEADLDEALGTIKNMKAASKFGSSNVSDMIRGEKARKAGMAKVSTTKDIGYKVVDVGPGQKETVRKMHNFKEEEDLDEASSAMKSLASKKKSGIERAHKETHGISSKRFAIRQIDKSKPTKHRVDIHVVYPYGDERKYQDVVDAKDKHDAIFSTQIKYGKFGKKMGYSVDKVVHKGMVKEEEDQINEISSDTLISYSQKAHNQIKGNQPADPDKLRKRTNREQGIKLAFNKHYQVRTKVPATIKEEEIDEAESGLSTKTLAGYSIKASDASKHRKLPTSKVDNRYAGVSKVDKILAARDKKKVD